MECIFSLYLLINSCISPSSNRVKPERLDWTRYERSTDEKNKLKSFQRVRISNKNVRILFIHGTNRVKEINQN